MKDGRKHLFVVDDEESIIYSLSLILARAGYRVTKADNGGDALRLIMEAMRSEDPIDLLICDLVMPEFTGAALIERLVADGVGIKIIAMTGVIDGALLNNLREKAEFVLLPKPFDRDELVKAVADTFAGKSVVWQGGGSGSGLGEGEECHG